MDFKDGKKLKFFDLHCDTLTEAEKTRQGLRRNNLHISLEKASCFEEYAQVFAIFIDDTLRGQAAVNYFDRLVSFYNAEMELNAAYISDFCTHSNKRKNKTQAILALEGAAATGGTLEGLWHLHDCGVKLVTLTWNDRNEIASGAWAKDDCGLTDFGKTVVREMEKLGMIIDISHISRKSFWNVADFTEKPFIASHSNCDLTDNEYGKRRNLNDSQIKCLIERKGLMGINFVSDFLHDGNISPFEAIYRHIFHALELGAEKILAFGCDFDGCKPHEDISGIDKIPSVYNFLWEKGLSESLLEDIFYNNAHNFFCNKQNL